jgi:hypothetical protein
MGLARSISRSASSNAWPSASRNAAPEPRTSAKPTETPTGVPGTSACQSSLDTATMIRRATSAASSMPAPGSTTTNSSPP